jgi:hypothetical protein
MQPPTRRLDYPNLFRRKHLEKLDGSLDGVLAPIDGANSPTEVRARAADHGRVSQGRAGCREAGCAAHRVQAAARAP